MDEIQFGTDGWRARRETFTPERVRAVAQGIVDYLGDDPAAPVAVGYDAREGARERAEECCRVFAGAGYDVVLSDRDCPTPSVAHAIVDRGLAGGVVLTASHNPATYLGIKFLPADGAPALPAVTDAIESNLRPPDPQPRDEHGTVREADFVTAHLDACRGLVDARLDGLTVAYDAIHGTGRGVTDELLERAGAEVVRIRCDRDPTFGGGSPDPTPENLTDLIDAVADGEADLGLANDGDADRLAVITPAGYLDPNYTLAVLYDHLLESDQGPVVRSISTTNLLDEIAADHGESAHETRVGFKWVAAAMAEHDALLGGEESGGFSVRGHVREKDGVLGALLVAAAAAETPIQDRRASLVDAYGEIHQDRRSVDCPDDRKREVVETLREALPETVLGVDVVDVNEADGVKLLLADDAWLLVRASGTEPKLRIYAEARDRGRADELLDAGEDLVDGVR